LRLFFPFLLLLLLGIRPEQVEELERILPRVNRKPKPDHAVEAPEMKVGGVVVHYAWGDSTRRAVVLLMVMMVMMMMMMRMDHNPTLLW